MVGMSEGFFIGMTSLSVGTFLLGSLLIAMSMIFGRNTQPNVGLIVGLPLALGGIISGAILIPINSSAVVDRQQFEQFKSAHPVVVQVVLNRQINYLGATSQPAVENGSVCVHDGYTLWDTGVYKAGVQYAQLCLNPAYTVVQSTGAGTAFTVVKNK